MTKRLSTVLVALLALLITVATSWAQSRTSAITGRVLDQSGAAVPRAHIEVRHVATDRTRSTVTDRSGTYRVPLLEVGEYEVTAEQEGFKISKHRAVRLEVDRDAVVEHVLVVGDVAESVVVTGRARLIEAAPSALTNLVDSDTIEQLPLNGRDYIQLATLQAGAHLARAQARDNVNLGYGLQISISGSRPYQNNISLDGVSLTTYNGSMPSSINGVNLGVDAIEEFSVHASTFSAQYGRSGGGVINAVTKSGSKEFHGTLFYFHRNDNLDARNFFDVGEPPEFRRHQYGASLGGPLSGKDTFFFVNYEGLREARGNTTINTTLTAEARQGRLSAQTVPVDPVMAKVAALYPLPNGEILGDTGLYIFANDVVGDQDFVTTRIDQNLSDTDKLFFRYSFDDAARENETDFALGIRSDSTRVQSAALEETHIFSASLLNTVRLGFLRTFTDAGRTTTQVPGTDDPNLAFVPGSGVIGRVQVSGLTDLPGGSEALDIDRYAFSSYQLSDDVNWMRGRHAVKIGSRIERTHFNADAQNRQHGHYRFRGIAQLLRNEPSRFQAQFAGSDTIRGHRQWIGALYVQDTWKLSQRLTLDVGLRWEAASVPTEVNGKVANLDSIWDTQVRVGDPMFENPSLNNFAPRVGLAWDVSGSGGTIVRGGYGIFPDLLLSQHLLFSGVRNPPFYIPGDTRDLATGDFPTGGFEVLLNAEIPGSSFERIQRDPSQPYVQQWNLNVEQTLDQVTTFRIGYVGSHGLNLSSIVVDANIAEPVTLADGRLFYPEGADRINPAFGRIRDRGFRAHSFYQGLQSRLSRRMSRGLQAQVSYTFSKSIDDSSNFFNNNESANSALLPLNDHPKFNRGLSSHDVRHYAAISTTWDLPLSEGRGWRRVLGGWQLGGIVTYASGLPMSAWLAYDAARTLTHQSGRTTNQRPDLAPGASNNPVTGDPNGWVDLSAFRRPEPGLLGNLGRNTIIGPDLSNVDFSLVKRMKIPRLGESASLDFRAEFFNLFNHTNFDLPDAERLEAFDDDFSREDFGRITSAGKSREIQFGLKLRF